MEFNDGWHGLGVYEARLVDPEEIRSKITQKVESDGYFYVYPGGDGPVKLYPLASLTFSEMKAIDDMLFIQFRRRP